MNFWTRLFRRQMTVGIQRKIRRRRRAARIEGSQHLEPRVLLTGEFTDLGNLGISNVAYSAVAWGDYDSDGDLDLVVSGKEGGRVTRIFQNNAGSFSDIAANLTPVERGSVAWGDYDNDGDLDLLLTGSSAGSGYVSKVYRNDSGTFTDISAGLAGVKTTGGSSVSWGDYDNDGDLDILLAGSISLGSYVSKVYRNIGGTFSDIGAGLPGFSSGSASWGDYDNDGDLDILLVGTLSGGSRAARVYQNTGGSFTDIGASLTGVSVGSAAWGDYDNDGDLDILLAGNTDSGKIARVYRNSGGTFSDISASLEGADFTSLAWGDYDNDGDLDILLTGRNASNAKIAKIYRNSNGTFSDLSAGLTGVYDGSVAWGDYDNDGDLDLLVTGDAGSSNRITRVYRNNSSTANTVPNAPTGLTATNTSATSIQFSWTAPTDGQTPTSGLSYNLRVGTTPGDSDVFSTMANTSTGYRRIPDAGPIQGISYTLKELIPGQKYYWSVQAVDTALAGGAFAAESQFQLQTTALIDGSGNLVVTDIANLDNNFTVEIIGVNVRISDSLQTMTAFSGATQDGANAVLIPLASITGGQIQLNSSGGNDTITFSNSGVFNKSLSIDGGSGNDTVNFNTSISLGTGGNLLVAAETIAQTASLTVPGTTLLNAGNAGSIALTNTSNDFQGALTIIFSNTASIVDTNDIIVNGAQATTSLTVTASSGTATVNGNISAPTTTITAAGSITQNASSNISATTQLTLNSDAVISQNTGSTISTPLLTVRGTTGGTSRASNFSANQSNNSIGGLDARTSISLLVLSATDITIRQADSNNAARIQTIGPANITVEAAASGGLGVKGSVVRLAGNSITLNNSVTATNSGVRLELRDGGLLSGSGDVHALGNTVSIGAEATGSELRTGNTAGAGFVTLSAATLNLVNAGTLAIGVNNAGTVTAGAVTIGDALAPAGTTAFSVSGNGAVSLGANLTFTSSVSVTSTGSNILQSAGTINATSLALSASSGIGSGVGGRIQTQVNNLEAQTGTGGIFIGNTGHLNIGGVSAGLSGVQVTSSGQIDLLNTAGNVRIVTLNEIVKGPGDVTIKTVTSGNIVTASNNGFFFSDFTGSVNSTGGNVTLDAAGNLDLGETSNVNRHGDVKSLGNLVLKAGGSITLDDSASAQSIGAGATISITAGNNISLLHTNFGDALLANQHPNAGLISITTGALGTFSVDAGSANPGILGGVGGIQIAADDMVIMDEIQAVTGGSVTLRTVTTGRQIDLGTNTGGKLSLTDAELDFITASALMIGDSGSGNVTIIAPVSPANATTLQVITGGAIGNSNTTTPDITATNVILNGNVSPGTSPGILTVSGNFAFGTGATLNADILGATAGTQHDQIAVTGTVNINNATLNINDTGFNAVGNEVIVLINNDGTDAVIGTFNGLPPASLVTVGGKSFQLSYTGGDGNDVVLAAPDSVAPTFTAQRHLGVPKHTNANDVSWVIQFSEAVSGVDNTDFEFNFVPAGGTLLTDAGDSDPSTYLLTAWNVPEGTLQIDQIINASGIRDRGGNEVGRTRQGASGSHVYKVDRTAPTPVISSTLSPGPTNADSIPISVNFGEGVFGFEQSDLVVTNGTVSNFATTDFQTFTFNVTPLANGMVTINIAAAAANDPALNNSNAASQFAITSRRVKAAITRMDPTPTLATSVRFHVNFSEDVTNVDAADFVVATTGSASGNVLVVVDDAGDTNASTWVVTVTGVSRHGTVGLDFAPVTDIRGVAFNTPITLAPTVDEVYDVINDARGILSQPARTPGNVVATVSGLNLFLTPDASDNGISISARADGAVVVAGMGGTTINGVAQFVAFSAVGGIAPGSVTVFKSGGRDFVSVADITVAGNLTVFAGDGVSAIDLRNVNVTGNTVLKEKAGDGFIDVNGGTFTGVASIFGGAGNNTIVVNNANFGSVLSIQSGDDNDSITLNNVSVTGSTSISTQAGNDQLTLTNTVHLSTLYILTAAGNDTIIGNNVDVTLTTYIATDAGNDVVDFNDLRAMSTTVLILGDDNNAARFLNSRFDGLVNIPISAGSNVVDIQGTTFNGATYLQASGGELGVRIKNNSFESGVILKGGPGSRDALLDNGTNSFAVPPVVSSFERMSLTHLDSLFENLLGLLFP